MLGALSEDYSDKLRTAEEKGWLKYHGGQSDVRPFIAAADCFVLPSWHEGMANTNLECAASGRPVITSNIPGCKEAVIDGVSGYLVECKNADDLFEKMLAFCNMTYEQRSAMGLAGRKHMEAVFDRADVVNKTMSYLMRQEDE